MVIFDEIGENKGKTRGAIIAFLFTCSFCFLVKIFLFSFFVYREYGHVSCGGVSAAAPPPCSESSSVRPLTPYCARRVAEPLVSRITDYVAGHR